jgi:TPR repeat protein
VFSGHGNFVNSAAYSPDGSRIVTTSTDKTARIWDARVPATIAAQILWDAAAETDPLPDVDRAQLGLLPDARVRKWGNHGSACDTTAAAFYDPNRLTSGTPQSDINADIANAACAVEAAKPAHAVRLGFQWGRALLAKHDLCGARRQLEFAVSKGYRAAGVDLGNLLTDPTAGMLDPQRAVSLYEKAWRDGVPIAAFALGHLYERGLPGAAVKFQTDLEKAWAWYQKGAEAGEPSALARFGEREERNALAEKDTSRADARLLEAFRFYGAAAERAHHEDWPDTAWRHWRYRRATLARLLAREGMMSQVADAYNTVREQRSMHATTLWEEMKARIHW